MTLRQDCELWATFDTEDVDESRGIVRDRSGKGRTLEASGGPTYGVSSPVGEAVGLDGVDDFLVNTNVTYESDATLGMIFKPADRQAQETFFSYAKSFRLKSGSANKRIAFEAKTSTGPTQVKLLDGDSRGEYVRVLGVYDDSANEIRGYAPDGLTDSESATTTATAGETQTNIGQIHFGDRRAEMDVAFAAAWGRTLDASDRRDFFEMTDRMVSRL